VIFVRFEPSDLKGDDADWWKRWSRRAEKARTQAIEDYAAGREHHFQDSVWTDLKEWLLRRVFHGKCAYCEALVGVTGFGDAEHFRTKGKVTILVDEKKVTVQVAGKDHP